MCIFNVHFARHILLFHKLCPGTFTKYRTGWTRYNNLIPLKLWNCREPVIYRKLQHLSMEAGALKGKGQVKSLGSSMAQGG